VPRVVGTSVFEQGFFVADRYRVVERLGRFTIADSMLTGVEYEYWLALDELRGVEVWLQVARSRGTAATGAQLAGVVSALRRIDHRAVPAVLDVGEIDVPEQAGEDGAELFAAVGYVVLGPVEAESLAAVLLRAALTEAEILAVLVEIADVLEVLHEAELVHGHLSAHSFLLVERGVLLVDLAAALALEAASDSELTQGADVYALAWLACIALVGVETVEAEFGVDDDAGSSPESALAPRLLTLDLVERRRAWAVSNLVGTHGIRPALAELLIAALGEASGRPTARALASALRMREDGAGALAAAQVEAAAESVRGRARTAGGRAAQAGIAVTGVAEAEVEEAESEFEEAEVEEAGLVEEAREERGAAAYVGAGLGAAAAATALGGGSRRGGPSAGSPGAPAPAAAVVAVTAQQAPNQPPVRRVSESRRPRSALYAAVVVVIAAVAAVVWALGSRGSSKAAPAGSSPAVGRPPAAGGSPSVGQSPVPSLSPSPVSSRSPLPVPSATAAAGAGQPSGTPGYTAAPLATAPASPGEALGLIKRTVSQARSAGLLPPQAAGPLNSAIGTLQREISGNSPTRPGINQLRSALSMSGVPAGFAEQISELIPYLVAGQGS
jgi:hypothetical protein